VIAWVVAGTVVLLGLMTFVAVQRLLFVIDRLDFRATERAQARADVELAERVDKLEVVLTETKDALLGMRMRGR